MPPMNSALKIALPALLLLALLAASGCNDESEPMFTRVIVNPQCGVVPLEIDAFAAATGGNESGDPTGGNNNLEVTWKFGDGATGSTSISYHIYDEPGEYTVEVTAQDPDGKTAQAFVPVTVRADTLTASASSNFHGELVNPEDEGIVETGELVLFDVTASACGLDPEVDDDYRQLSFTWSMNDGTGTKFYTRRPVYSFATAGEYTVDVIVTLPALACTRHSSVTFTVVDP